ncbi:MAG: hypothetical protein ACXAC5_00020 [Promethearchaeota archaeon]|jgi:hypothetical protein
MEKNENDKTIIGFRAWYENSQVFDSKTITWENLPDDGLIVVILYENKRLRSGDGHYRRICSNKNYYWIVLPNLLDVFYDDDNPVERYPGAIVKRGKWVPYAEYEAVTKEAMETIEF